MMNRSRAFLKMCDKMNQQPEKVIHNILSADTGTKIKYGNYTLISNGPTRLGSDIRYHLYLYKDNILVTSILADIDS